MSHHRVADICGAYVVAGRALALSIFVALCVASAANAASTRCQPGRLLRGRLTATATSCRRAPGPRRPALGLRTGAATSHGIDDAEFPLSQYAPCMDVGVRWTRRS